MNADEFDSIIDDLAEIHRGDASGARPRQGAPRGAPTPSVRSTSRRSITWWR